MDPLALGVAASVASTVFLLLMGLGRRNFGAQAMSRRLDALGRETAGPEATVPKQGSFLRESPKEGTSLLRAIFGGSERMAVDLERAGIPLRVSEFNLIRWGLAGVLFLLPLIVDRSIIGFVLAVVLGFIGFMLPPFYVGNKKKSRTAKINAQLVDLLSLISNSLKAGYALMQSFEFAGQQLRPPLSLELKRMLRETTLGKSAEEALLTFGERINSPDLDMVLTAINIQRAVGGNLAEILENVSFTMRERERIRGDIRTLTAQQRMTGIVIGSLPVGIGGLFMLLNPDYMSLLFTETAGQIMLATATGLEVLGVVVMRRILAIDV